MATPGLNTRKLSVTLTVRYTQAQLTKDWITARVSAANSLEFGLFCRSHLKAWAKSDLNNWNLVNGSSPVFSGPYLIPLLSWIVPNGGVCFLGGVVKPSENIMTEKNNQADREKPADWPGGSPGGISATVGRDGAAEKVRENFRRMVAGDAAPGEWAYSWRRELNRGGFRAVDFLMEEIVNSGKCIGCASCVTICPTDVFDYRQETPVDTRTDACVQCVLCTEVCPVLRPADQDMDALVQYGDNPLDEGYGPYVYGLYTRSTDQEILARCQDGGLVSTLLTFGLANGSLKGAVIGDVLPEDNQIGRHILAKTREHVLQSAASRYTYSPNNLALADAMGADVNPIAVVGVPCQINGLRYQQNSAISQSMVKWLRKNVALTIGLFCSEAFTHESLDKLAEIIGTERRKIRNINIKGKVVVRLDDGEVREASLKKYREFARPACLYCTDYSAELADIGAGGIGLDGWTYTLVRTKRGHEALQAAIEAGLLQTRPLSDEPRGEFLMQKLSADKKQNRPHPAQMPTYQERAAQAYLDPKTYYTKGPGARKAEPDNG